MSVAAVLQTAVGGWLRLGFQPFSAQSPSFLHLFGVMTAVVLGAMRLRYLLRFVGNGISFMALPHHFGWDFWLSVLVRPVVLPSICGCRLWLSGMVGWCPGSCDGF